MATQAQYKKYKRGQRQAVVETDFSKGMMYSEGAVADGYVKSLVNFDFTSDGQKALKPRAGLKTCEFIVPDILSNIDDVDDFLNDDTALKYSKECVENGVTYRQIIFGLPHTPDDGTGTIWVMTSPKSLKETEGIVLAESYVAKDSSSCMFYNTALTEIHGCQLVSDAKTSFPIGAFLGNSFYFFDNNGVLRKTKFDTTVSPARYVFETAVEAADRVVDPTASEAVNYGYNMLEANPYVFSDAASANYFEMHGILPYDGKFEAGQDAPNLLMTPRANSRVWFRCNYDVTTTKDYSIVWSWKEVNGNDDWTVFNTQYTNDDPFNSTDTPVLQADLIVPSKAILIRCEAYDITDFSGAVEKAMTVGFDFSLDEHGTTLNVPQENYNLSHASGMVSFQNRLVLWGVTSDPTILFISDLDEPGYFPYPNNITVFDDPIMAVTELMGDLIVFTTNKIYQVALNDDGVTWITTVLQSNLYINPWDKHLIQPVRNMLYFKSGNYYYMLVPKAQSTTGELTLAPITTPITDFFNKFSVNVESVFKECFKTIDSDTGTVVDHIPTDMITYYNFIDYECVHNLYVYKYDAFYVHFDVIYNTVDRYWKINIYESSGLIYPFRNDATQQGVFANTLLLNTVDALGVAPDAVNRAVQLLSFSSDTVEDNYILNGITLSYDSSNISLPVSGDVLEIDELICSYWNEILTISPAYVRLPYLRDEILWMLDASDRVGGFSGFDIVDSLSDSLEELRSVTVFPNKQMLDTGYRDSNLFINKRYRELQLHINNLDDVDMEFGMDFRIQGEPRNTDFMYEVSQTIDELSEEYGIAYLEAVPYFSESADSIIKVNQWTLKHLLDWSVSLWKVRAAVSGKGAAPRLRLFSRKQFNYQLLGINWVYREMNMR